jgi:MATE family multidrug resistance protein
MPGTIVGNVIPIFIAGIRHETRSEYNFPTPMEDGLPGGGASRYARRLMHGASSIATAGSRATGYARTALALELRPLLKLAWPVVLAEVAWMTMGLVDTMMVGRVSAEAIGAVAIGSSLFFAIAMVGGGVLLGLDHVVSHAWGGGRIAEGGRALVQGLYLAAALSVLLLVLLRLAADELLPRIGIEPTVLALAMPYLRVLAPSIVPLLFFMALRRYLQAIGHVRPIMIAALTANVVNLAANWMLIFGHLGAPALGVIGSAWATTIARFYMFVFIVGVAWLHARRESPEVLAVSLRPDFEILRRIVRLGVPAASQTAAEVGGVLRRDAARRSSRCGVARRASDRARRGGARLHGAARHLLGGRRAGGTGARVARPARGGARRLDRAPGRRGVHVAVGGGVRPLPARDRAALHRRPWRDRDRRVAPPGRRGVPALRRTPGGRHRHPARRRRHPHRNDRRSRRVLGESAYRSADRSASRPGSAWSGSGSGFRAGSSRSRSRWSPSGSGARAACSIDARARSGFAARPACRFGVALTREPAHRNMPLEPR